MDRSDAVTVEVLLSHAEGVRALARRLVADRHRADDVEQDAWVAALEQSRRGRLSSAVASSTGGAPALGAWFARVLQNFALRAGRTRARVRAREEHAARHVAEPSTAEICERAELHRALVEHVLALDEPYRTTLLLRYFEGLSPSAIARRDGTPVRTIHTRIARGHQRLRERLERTGIRDGTSWAAACAVLARSFDPRRQPLAGGILVMSSKSKIALAVVLALALVGGIVAVSGIERSSANRPADAFALRSPPESEHAPAGEPSRSERVSLDVAAPASARRSAAADELRGRVVDSDGSGIAGASVSAWRDAAREFQLFLMDEAPGASEVARTTTDPDGSFVLPLPPDRPFDVRARTEGRPTAHARGCYAGESITILLTRGASLSGTVRLAPESGVVPGARVVLSDAAPTTYSSLIASSRFAEATTASDGTYRFGAVPAGRFLLRVQASGAATSDWLPVELVEGQSVDRDVVLERGASIEGSVIDARTRAPIAGARLFLGSEPDRRVSTDERGRYRFDGVGVRRDARPRLNVAARGYARQVIALDPTDVVSAHLDFELSPGVAVRGRIVDAGAQALAGCLVATLEENERTFETVVTSTTSATDGRFEVRDVSPEDGFVLYVHHDGHATRQLPVPRPPAGTADLDVGDVRLDASASVSGRLVDRRGTPVPDVTIWLGADQYVRLARTTADGRFGFTDVAAGTHEVSARVDGYPISNEARFELAAGQSLQGVELVVAPRPSIRGRVVRRDATPVGFVRLRAVPERADVDRSDWTRQRFGTSRSDGAFEIFVSADDEPYALVASSPAAAGDPLATQWMRGVRSGNDEVRMVLAPSVPVAGRVVTATGRPVEHIAVVAFEGDDEREIDASTTTASDGSFRLLVRDGSIVTLLAKHSQPKSEAGPARTWSARIEGVVAGSEGILLELAERE